MPSGGAAGGMDRGGYGAEKSGGYGDSGGYGGGSDRGGYGGGGSREYHRASILSPSLYVHVCHARRFLEVSVLLALVGMFQSQRDVVCTKV